MMVRRTFEATYPHYPFAPLVRAGMSVAAWLNSRRRSDARPDGDMDDALGSAA